MGKSLAYFSQQHLPEAATKPLDPKSAAIRQELITLLKSNDKSVETRIMRMGLSPACSRCGGSGHYSFNLMDGTKCYGCMGMGYMRPTSLKAWQYTLDNAKRAVANGELAEYEDRLAAQQRVNTMAKNAMKSWTASGISDKYEWRDVGSAMSALLYGKARNVWVDVHVDDVPIEPVKTWEKPFSKELLANALYSDINSYYSDHYTIRTHSVEILNNVLLGKHKSAADRRVEYNDLLDELDKKVLPAIEQHERKLQSLIGRVPSIADSFMNGHTKLRFKRPQRYANSNDDSVVAGWIEDLIGSVPSVVKQWIIRMRTQYKSTEIHQYEEDV